MERQFIELQQGDRTIDAYTIEFIKLSWFALALVVSKEDRVYRFMQGLQFGILKHLASQVYMTNSDVFGALIEWRKASKEVEQYARN